MGKEKFNIIINSSKEKVWQILWNDETYRKWTSAFNEGSYMESDWKVGGKTLFLDGKGNGMVSTIAEIKPNDFVLFKHLGMLNNGVEDLNSESVKQWAGALENYTLNSLGDKTELIVELDLEDEYKDSFAKIWVKAFEIIKSLVEE